MHVIQARNVNEALPSALHDLRAMGIERDSRNGPVLVFPTPVTTVYNNPMERVLFSLLRDANPFFHLYEAIWMLGGRNDVAGPAHYVQRMRDFSDNGVTFHGAYGFRWRTHFGIDQVRMVIDTLKSNKDDRRCVIQMWDSRVDLGQQGKDFPCNTQIMFAINYLGSLDMTVLNRSNDIVWGAYGANAVHFSVLQEFMARSIGVPVGTYYQVSNNFHGYLSTVQPLMQKLHELEDEDFYSQPELNIEPFPLMSTEPEAFMQDVHLYLNHGPVVGLNDPFFTKVVQPMHHTFNQWKNKHDPERFEKAREIANQIAAKDWRVAAKGWLFNREAKAKAAA